MGIFGWSLPPGVTNSDIEEQCADRCFDCGRTEGELIDFDDKDYLLCEDCYRQRLIGEDGAAPDAPDY